LTRTSTLSKTIIPGPRWRLTESPKFKDGLLGAAGLGAVPAVLELSTILGLLPEKTFPRISSDLQELAGQRRHRVPAPHPVGRAEPARRPHFRNRTSEQGFPRRLRRRPILIATIYGMRDIEPVALETARSFRTRPHERLPRAVLPSAARGRWSPTCTPPG